MSRTLIKTTRSQHS